MIESARRGWFALRLRAAGSVLVFAGAVADLAQSFRARALARWSALLVEDSRRRSAVGGREEDA